MPFQMQVGQSSSSGGRREEGEPPVASPERDPQHLPQTWPGYEFISSHPIDHKQAKRQCNENANKGSKKKKKAKQNLYSHCLILWVLIIPSAYNHVCIEPLFNINPGMEVYVRSVGPGSSQLSPLSPKAGFAVPLRLGQTSLRFTPASCLQGQQQ